LHIGEKEKDFALKNSMGMGTKRGRNFARRKR